VRTKKKIVVLISDAMSIVNGEIHFSIILVR
jgi:hypothetical protein